MKKLASFISKMDYCDNFSYLAFTILLKYIFLYFISVLCSLSCISLIFLHLDFDFSWDFYSLSKCSVKFIHLFLSRFMVYSTVFFTFGRTALLMSPTKCLSKIWSGILGEFLIVEPKAMDFLDLNGFFF